MNVTKMCFDECDFRVMGIRRSRLAITQRITRRNLLSSEQNESEGTKMDGLNDRNFSSFEDVFRRLLLLHLPLEQDLEGEPRQEEDELGQGDQREAAQHRQPASDRAWWQGHVF